MNFNWVYFEWYVKFWMNLRARLIKKATEIKIWNKIYTNWLSTDNQGGGNLLRKLPAPLTPAQLHLLIIGYLHAWNSIRPARRLDLLHRKYLLHMLLYTLTHCLGQGSSPLLGSRWDNFETTLFKFTCSVGPVVHMRAGLRCFVSELRSLAATKYSAWPPSPNTALCLSSGLIWCILEVPPRYRACFCGELRTYLYSTSSR